MGRKHMQLFEVEAQIRTDDVAKLRDAVASRRESTLVITAADGDNEETTADFTEFFISYGPVRGANRTDVTRFFDRQNVSYLLDDTTAVTSRVCGCASSSQPCADGVVARAGRPEWAGEPQYET